MFRRAQAGIWTQVRGFAIPDVAAPTPVQCFPDWAVLFQRDRVRIHNFHSRVCHFLGYVLTGKPVIRSGEPRKSWALNHPLHHGNPIRINGQRQLFWTTPLLRENSCMEKPVFSPHNISLSLHLWNNRILWVNRFLCSCSEFSYPLRF